MIATARTVHSVDRPADLVNHIVNPCFAEFLGLFAAQPHGWLRTHGPDPNLRDLLIYDQKSKVPQDLPDRVIQAVCRLIDARVVLEHKGLSKQLGPPQTETKSMLDLLEIRRLG